MEQEQTATLLVAEQDAPEAEAADLLVGKVIDGKYQILSLLGTGGMSAVYRAKQLLLNKDCAVKLLHRRFVTDSNAITRFSQEAKAASALSHPNIIQVFDIGLSDGQPYQAIEFIQGRSLSEEIKKSGGLPIDRALHILLQAAAALEHAHKHGVIHRDLKPSNIMLVDRDDEPDFVYLLDFGIAKILPHEGEHVQQLTQTGEILGSPFYMSPEQCIGSKLDARSDIYSMGCLIYEIFAGKPPLAGNNIFETIQKHQDEMPSSLKTTMKEPAFADRLDAIICKAMAKDPNQRYQTMAELGEDLLAIEAGTSTTFSEKVRRRWHLALIKLAPHRRRYPVRILASMALTVLLLFALVCYMAQALAVISIPPFTAEPWPKYTSAIEKEEIVDDSSNLLANGAISDLLVDTAERQVRAAKDEAGQLETSLQLASSYLAKGRYDVAAHFYDKVRYLWSRGVKSNFDNLTQKEILLAKMGDAYYYNDQPDVAQHFYSEARVTYIGQAERNEKRLAMKAADAELSMHRYRESMQDFLRASTGRKDDIDDAAFPDYVFNRPKEASPQVDAALFVSKLGDCARELGQIAFISGDSKRANANFELAEKSYQSAIREWQRCLNETPKVNKYLATTYFRLSEVESALKKDPLNDLHQAIACLNDKDSRDASNLAALWQAVALNEKQKGNWWQAINAENESKTFARQTQNKRN